MNKRYRLLKDVGNASAGTECVITKSSKVARFYHKNIDLYWFDVKVEEMDKAIKQGLVEEIGSLSANKKEIQFAKDYVCKLYDVTDSELRRKRRLRKIVLARALLTNFLIQFNMKYEIIGETIDKDYTMIWYYRTAQYRFIEKELNLMNKIWEKNNG